MKYEQILKELEKIEDLESRLKFLNKLLKEIDDEELRKKIVKLMEDIISPEVQHYDRSHYRMEFEPSETMEVAEPERAPTPARETPDRVEPTPEARLKPEGEDLTDYAASIESTTAYKTLERIEEDSRKEDTTTPEQKLFEVAHKRRSVEVEGAERKLFEAVHSDEERRRNFVRESPKILEPSFDTEQMDVNPEQLDTMKRDVGVSEYKTPDQARDEKMRAYKRRIE